MRIRYPLCFTILSAATAIPALAQQEQLIAHTRCAVVDGRVALSRGLELAPIPIVGTKQEMAGTICDRTRSPPACETKQVFRMDVLCTGTRVPWIAVYAAHVRDNRRFRFDGSRISTEVAGRWESYPDGFAPLDGAKIATVSAPPVVAPATMIGPITERKAVRADHIQHYSMRYTCDATSGSVRMQPSPQPIAQQVLGSIEPRKFNFCTPGTTSCVAQSAYDFQIICKGGTPVSLPVVYAAAYPERSRLNGTALQLPAGHSRPAITYPFETHQLWAPLPAAFAPLPDSDGQFHLLPRLED